MSFIPCLLACFMSHFLSLSNIFRFSSKIMPSSITFKTIFSCFIFRFKSSGVTVFAPTFGKKLIFPFDSSIAVYIWLMLKYPFVLHCIKNSFKSSLPFLKLFLYSLPSSNKIRVLPSTILLAFKL